jgi:hypothetical protein
MFYIKLIFVEIGEQGESGKEVKKKNGENFFFGSRKKIKNFFAPFFFLNFFFQEQKDSIRGEGLMTFQKDLGIIEDDDPGFLILAYKFRTETTWEISKEEFTNGFTINA